MVSVTSHKSFMVGMPVYIRIKATLTGNYSMSIVITIDDQGCFRSQRYKNLKAIHNWSEIGCSDVVVVLEVKDTKI